MSFSAATVPPVLTTDPLTVTVAAGEWRNKFKDAELNSSFIICSINFTYF